MITVAKPNAFGRMSTDAYPCLTYVGPFPGMMERPKTSVRCLLFSSPKVGEGWPTAFPGAFDGFLTRVPISNWIT